MTTASAGSPLGARPEGARSRSDNIAVGAADAPATPSNPTTIREETARELLAVEYDRAGYHRPASRVRQGQFDDFDTAAIRAILSALGPPPTEVREGVATRETWRHVKRGTLYEVLGDAELQDAAGFGQHEHACLTIYRGEDGKLWARNSAEFQDGRFERIATPPMRDREAIAKELLPDREAVAEALCNDLGARWIADKAEAPLYCDSSSHVQSYWLALADQILSLSPSPCDCLVREALRGLIDAAENVADSYNTCLMDDQIAAARTALQGQTGGEGK